MSRMLPLLLAPALLLGGCGGTYSGGLETAHQPVVQRNDYVLDLRSTGYGLAAGEARRLAGWFAAMNLRYGDRVSIDDGADGETGRAEIAVQVKEYGLLLSEQAPVTVGQIAPGTVRVVVTRMTAGVPNCPDFSRTNPPDFSASTNSNFGCATSSNLAAMIADPGDLVRGAPGARTADPTTAGKAINALRDAKPSGGGGTTLTSGGGSK
jgi:pilus assembly protein CpaD